MMNIKSDSPTESNVIKSVTRMNNLSALFLSEKIHNEDYSIDI